MMLRPATPLSVLLAAAFVLLLLAVLSVPVIKAIPLGEHQGTTFGVFGYCKSDGSCSSISIGYDIGTMSGAQKAAFDLPASVRNTLSAILVVHPVAALVTLIMLVMAVAAHFHSPSHSSRYLLIIFIFTTIDFILCLLAFVVDVLLFIPHLAWGSYIVLAATIMVAICGVMACFMRRTLISRKARKKRIAENAEMSGENFYNREAQSKAAFGVMTEPATASVVGANSGGTDTSTGFFSENRKEDQVSDERIPLTQRSPLDRSPNSVLNEVNAVGEVSGLDSRARSQSRDRYGNPAPGAPEGYGVAGRPSYERTNARGRGDMRPPGFRGGRGGYGRGGFDQFGRPMRGRGGYGPRGGVGGYGTRGARGGYGPPRGGMAPPGWTSGGRSQSPMAYGGMPGSFDRRPSPAEGYAEYSQESSDQPLAYDANRFPQNNYEPYNPSTASYPRAESPPPMAGSDHAGSTHGQATEMDANMAIDSTEYGQFGQLRDNDTDVAGMVGLQQGHGPGPHETYASEESKYSQDGSSPYIPPGAAWEQGQAGSAPREPSPLNGGQNSAEIETPGGGTQPPPVPPSATANYYEDVDPRFAGPSPGTYPPPPIEPAYEDVHATVGGARSPAESERSNFTSISQRGINPQWQTRPPMPPYPQNYLPPRQQVQRRQDMLLDMPDFQVPGSSSRGGRRGAGPGMIPGSAYPTGPM